MVGWKKGIGYHGDDAEVFFNDDMPSQGGSYVQRSTSYTEYGQTAKPEIVGCGFDLQTRAVFFTLNGKYLGKVCNLQVTDKLFPAVSLADMTEITVNFGASPFCFEDWGDDFDDLLDDNISN